MAVGAKLYIKTQTLSKECLEMKFQSEMWYIQLMSLIPSVATFCMMHAMIIRRRMSIVLHHCYTRTMSTNKRQSMRNDQNSPLNARSPLNDNRTIYMYMYNLLAKLCCLSSSGRTCMIRPFGVHRVIFLHQVIFECGVTFCDHYSTIYS